MVNNSSPLPASGPSATSARFAPSERPAEQARVDLSGALVLVTGAGRGIGRATALAFAGRGARIVAVDVDAGAAEKTSVACAERGVPGAAFTCDVSDWEAVAGLARDVEAACGPVDVLVNNAGVGMTGRFADTSVEDWRWIRGVNLDGVVHGCRAFGPPMVARGRGHVVNVSSGLGYTPRATEPAYVTTKAAVLALSRCLRADWGPCGVGVSAVCPGIVNTPIVASTRYLGTRDDARTRRRIEWLFGSGHPPEKVAAAVVDAVVRNRALVPVGWEARLGWWLQRLSPLAWQDAAARREVV